MSDETLSAALKEAYASAPTNDVLLHTLELRHSAFDQPIRVVLDHVDHMLTLEAGAPTNPGTSVNFVGFAFELTLPEMSDSGVPELSIRIDNVDRAIIANIELSMQTPEQIEVTYRPYLASDPATCQMDPPMTLQINHIEADVSSITARCTFGDMSNRTFPGQVYTIARFPGLET